MTTNQFIIHNNLMSALCKHKFARPLPSFIEKEGVFTYRFDKTMGDMKVYFFFIDNLDKNEIYYTIDFKGWVNVHPSYNENLTLIGKVKTIFKTLRFW